MSLYECSGFERNDKAEVTIFWECQKCGYEIAGGLDRPEIPCPCCGAQDDESNVKAKK